MLYDDKNIFPLMKMWKWSKKIQKYFLLGLLHSTHLPSILASWQEGFHHYCHCACEHVLLSIIPNNFLFVYIDKQNYNLVKFFPHNIFSSRPNHFHCIITMLSSPSMSSMQSTMSLSSSSVLPTSPVWTPGKKSNGKKTWGNPWELFSNIPSKISKIFYVIWEDDMGKPLDYRFSIEHMIFCVTWKGEIGKPLGRSFDISSIIFDIWY